MAILRTEHLGREIEGKRILDDINLEVAEGEVVAIVGPSGSGKSSLLRLLNRLDEPTSGTVYFAGQDYRALAPAELRRRVGMVMQTAFLFPRNSGGKYPLRPRATRRAALRASDRQSAGAGRAGGIFQPRGPQSFRRRGPARSPRPRPRQLSGGVAAGRAHLGARRGFQAWHRKSDLRRGRKPPADLCLS